MNLCSMSANLSASCFFCLVPLSIAGKTVEKPVTPEDSFARFTLELEPGDYDLETWLIGEGKDGVAYFVTGLRQRKCVTFCR